MFYLFMHPSLFSHLKKKKVRESPTTSTHCPILCGPHPSALTHPASELSASLTCAAGTRWPQHTAGGLIS